MAPLLRINGRDLSGYLRVHKEDGFDPANEEAWSPQFSGAPAFREGFEFVSDAVGNREWTIPLLLSADTRGDLHRLVQAINRDLENGKPVEFASDSADDATHFTLQRGKLTPEYDYFLTGVHHTTRATLKLWTQAFGNTGTARLLSSQVATGLAVISATGILGDADAEGVLDVRLPAGGNVANPLIFWGLKYPVPSGYSPLRRYPGNATTSVVAASIFGASGRLGSQYYGVAVPPGAINTGLGIQTLRNQDYGRYRLLVSARLRMASVGSYAQLFVAAVRDNDGVVATNRPIALSSYWEAYDLGEITVAPSAATGYETLFHLTLNTASAPAATAVATYPLQLEYAVLMPVDQGAGFLGQNPKRVTWESLGESPTVGFRFDARIPAYEEIVAGTTLRYGPPEAYRGDYPMIPPTGSPMASGAAGIYALSLRNETGSNELLTDQPYTIALSARERFRFLR
jgi:hypothetical protein